MPEFIYFQSNNNDTKWLTTVLAGYPFYRSSGYNSGYPNTWFPYQGFQPFEVGTFPKGTLIKPCTRINNKQIDQFFSGALLSYLQDIVDRKNIVSRFGNQEAMFLSMLIGGGFWETDYGKDLNTFICKNYDHELEKLKLFYCNEIKEMQIINKNKPIPILYDVEISKLNEWLKNNGSRSNDCERTFNNQTYLMPEISFILKSFDIEYIKPKLWPYQVKQKQKVIEAFNHYLRHRNEHLRWYQSNTTGENRAKFYMDLLKRKEEENIIYENIVIYAIFCGKNGPNLQKKVYQVLGFNDSNTAMMEYQSRINEFYKENKNRKSIIYTINFIAKEIRKYANNNKKITDMADTIHLLDELSLSEPNSKCIAFNRR